MIRQLLTFFDTCGRWMWQFRFLWVKFFILNIFAIDADQLWGMNAYFGVLVIGTALVLISEADRDYPPQTGGHGIDPTSPVCGSESELEADYVREEDRQERRGEGRREGCGILLKTDHPAVSHFRFFMD